LITNQVGQAVWRWDNSDPFGGNVPDENPSGLGNFTCNLRLPGQYFDRETNLHYNYFRDYDPGIGRYVQPDPIHRLMLVDSLITRGEVQTPTVMQVPIDKSKPQNWWPYAYAYQDPVRYTDMFGLEVRPPCDKSPSSPCSDFPSDDPYYQRGCCIERCKDYWKCDRWWHWVTPTGAVFCVGNIVGCAAVCAVNPRSY